MEGQTNVKETTIRTKVIIMHELRGFERPLVIVVVVMVKVCGESDGESGGVAVWY